MGFAGKTLIQPNGRRCVPVLCVLFCCSSPLYGNTYCLLKRSLRSFHRSSFIWSLCTAGGRQVYVCIAHCFSLHSNPIHSDTHAQHKYQHTFETDWNTTTTTHIEKKTTHRIRRRNKRKYNKQKLKIHFSCTHACRVSVVLL